MSLDPFGAVLCISLGVVIALLIGISRYVWYRELRELARMVEQAKEKIQ